MDRFGPGFFRLALALFVGVLGFAPPSLADRSTASAPFRAHRAAQSGDYRWSFTSAGATLRLRLRRLGPNRELALVIDSARVATFTSDARGRADLALDLADTGVAIAPTYDPRDLGLFIFETQLGQPVLWGNPIDDPLNGTRAGRWTETATLAPSGGAPGGASAQYVRLPGGERRLEISLTGAAPGDHEITVDGAVIGAVTPNAAGKALAVLGSRTPGASGGAGTKRASRLDAPLAGRGHRAAVEIRRAGNLEFAGEVHAQIPGLDTCLPASRSAPLVPLPGATGSGDFTISREASCDVHVTLTLADVPVERHYLLTVEHPSSGWTFLVPDAGSGTGSIVVDFDEHPNASEFPLLDGLRSGETAEVGIYGGGPAEMRALIP